MITHQYTHTVTQSDLAIFHKMQIHPFYSTFSIARDAEWACRLCILDLLDHEHEGIGTFLEIQHKSAALLGQKIVFESQIIEQNLNEIICSFTAKVNDRIIAIGKTGQKILKKEKINTIIQTIINE